MSLARVHLLATFILVDGLCFFVYAMIERVRNRCLNRQGCSPAML